VYFWAITFFGAIGLLQLVVVGVNTMNGRLLLLILLYCYYGLLTKFLYFHIQFFAGECFFW
jgi:hypothetical protein